MEIRIETKQDSYPVIVEKGSLKKLNDFYSFKDKKVLLISDDNIPSSYLSIVSSQIKNAFKFIIKHGEESKSQENYFAILNCLLKNEFSRNDVVIGLGGGVTTDLSGFVAATFKRGLDLILIPTSTLGMLDASIGGKNAIDLGGVKNVVGTFYSPKLVLVDLDTLSSLDERNINSGLIEGLKMGYIGDQHLVNLFKENVNDHLEEIIIKSIQMKKEIVEKDFKESSLRKVLNLGHTIGHAYEAIGNFKTLLHGEAVGIGLLYVVKEKEELISILQKLNIKVPFIPSEDDLIKIIKNDKKAYGNNVDLIISESYSSSIKNVSFEELRKIIKGGEQYVRCLR